MIITVLNESPFQILSSSFSIGPSQTGYELQVGADSKSFTTLFSVGANTPRMVTNVANGSYYRLKNNVGEVKVNWQRVCVDEGGSGGSGGTTYTAGDYIDLTGDVISVTGITPDAYLTSADTEDLATKQYVQDALSGVDLSNFYTSAQTDAAISAATSGKADAANVTANTYMQFPKWNAQGVITGTTGNNLTTTGFYLNGTRRNLIKEAASGDLGDAYAPITPGNAGEILVSAGHGAPVWSAVTIPDTSLFVTSAQVETQIESALEDIELPIAAAVNDLKTNIEARLNQKYYVKQEIDELLAPKRDAAQVQKQIVDYVTPVVTDITAAIEDKELATSAALNDLNDRTVKSATIKTIWSGSQSAYNELTNSGATADPSTFYIITNNN